MHKQVLIGILVVAFCLTGCGQVDMWTVRRTAVDGEFYVGTAAYGLIQAQAASGMEPTIPESELERARAANTVLLANYALALDAIAKKDEPAFMQALVPLTQASGTLVAIKDKYCPVRNKDKGE